MSRICSSKLQKSKNLVENENDFKKCNFKLKYPPVLNSEDMYIGMKADETNLRTNKLKYTQNFMSKGKLKFQCHFEERKRRAELRRKKIIQKLKKNYKIDVEGLNEDVTREIIMKAEILEREKKEKEKRNIERTTVMITRLLEEQKYKNRGSNVYKLPLKKISKNVPKISVKEKDLTEKENSETELAIALEGKNEILNEKVAEQSETSVKKGSLKPTEIKHSIPKDQIQESAKEEELLKCTETKTIDDSFQIDTGKTLVRKSNVLPCISVEKNLESTPKRIVFQDYEKNKVYLQDLKITNIGLETIHCRYLGIVVHTKGENRFPVGVAVRDNVKLRPGLCCSTKIRLCSQDDSKELQGSIVYETRRKNNPLQHSWFFVQVLCLPIRAVVKVIPLKINFPTLTWCEATGPEGAQVLKKFIKIENSGKKACSCKISTEKLEADIDTRKAEEEEEEGETEEIEEEALASKSKLSMAEETELRSKKSLSSEEFFGENYSLTYEKALETAMLLVNEIFENIFVTFRFSRKFYIEIPPCSTTQIEVRFIPHYKGFHHEIHFVQFEDCDNCKEQAIEIVGDIERIPLRAEPQVIDLKTCIINSGVYAGTFKIFNESKGPYSVFLRVPSAIKKHANVHPRATTILPLSCSEFSVRIYPRISLARDAPQYYKEDSQVLEFPVFIHPGKVGACKRDNIKIYVFALITDYCLQLSPSFLNFGTVTTLETVRTEMELINHSLAIQEYGFLHLPKGVRVEPNMGFGRILPKESITLYVLFSPGENLIENDKTQEVHEFQITVTSIAKYGGFREKPEPEEESAKSFDFYGVEEHSYELSLPRVNSYADDQTRSLQAEDMEDSDICEEDSLVEGEEEICSRIFEQENKIRAFLKQDGDKISEHSFFKRMNLQAPENQQSEANEVENLEDNLSEFGEFEESEELKGLCALKHNLHIVNCRALVLQPRCRMSESVIQLPATPCLSFSLYRFQINANNEAADSNCSCGFRRVSKKCRGKSRYQSSFEFQYFCPHFKLEPESGFIKSGDSLPITVIFRPEFPSEQLLHESRAKKAQKFVLERKAEKDTSASQTNAGIKQSKGKQTTPKMKSPELNYENAFDDFVNASLFDLENHDLFSGERSLQQLISPFCVETRLQCIIKTIGCDNENETTEIHEMVFICPVIKPNFIYLGNSHEIRFNKVFVGTKSKMLLQIQNISFERISPSVTLLNPLETFHCPAGIRKVEVDPEHIWSQPLVYAPLEVKGIEKQFFEIYYNSTNIFLTVSGEGVQPEYRITPNFSCCLIEAKPGVVEELKMEIENLSTIKLNICIKVKFVKEGFDTEKDDKMSEEMSLKKETASEKEEVKDKKKSKNSESDKNIRFWDEIPEHISSRLEDLVDIEDADLISKLFSLIGVNDINEAAIPPYGRQQIKIQFLLPLDRSDRTYAIKFAFMLERVSQLKEILVMGKICKGK